MAGTPETRFELPKMTRCECASLSFREIRARLLAGQSFDDLAHRTGCGQTCTACVPDLKEYLALHPASE